jgi:omega-6 fatty acid desaturase (delta-12 desaturase)
MTTPAYMGSSGDWTELVGKYQSPVLRRSIRQVCNSFVPFLAVLVLMYLSLELSYWLTLLLAVPAAGFLARIFIIQHDCGHGSFFKSTRANDRLGFICSLITLTPYRHWRQSHAIHHRGAANLAKRSIGSIGTLTTREFSELSRWKRLYYRVYRHPLILFGVAPFFNFVVAQRVMFTSYSRKEWASLHWTNLALGAVAAVLALTIGLKPLVLIYTPIIAIASSVGTWLFYVQHQYEQTYWVSDKEWDYTLAALKGSSYYKLPALLQWFTGNIGFHHVHHLCPKIPNYRLEQCHDENPMFQQATVLTLSSSLRTASLGLWDEENQRLVGFKHIRSVTRPRPETSLQTG